MSKLKVLFLVSLILGLPISTIFAQEIEEQVEANEDVLDKENDVEKSEEEVELELLNEKFLEAKNQATEAQSDLRKSINETSYLEQKLESITEQILDLEKQVGSLEERIEDLTNDIKQTKEKIEKIDIELKKIKEEIEKLDQDLSYYTEQLLFVIQALYFESDKAGFFDEEELQMIKLLLAEDDVDTILEEAENVSMLENHLQITLENIEQKRSEMNELYNKFQDLKRDKILLKEKQEKENVELQIQRLAKENLLESSKGEQKVYEKLIEKSKTEEALIRQEIVAQISKYKEYKTLIDSLSGEEGAEDDATFLSWPVKPKLGISAGFKDPSYRAALGIDHYAIDIPTYQATPVGSAAPGVVFKVKGGEGNDYHYVLIGHNNGLMTLYGHMYDIYVEEGQAIERGEVIGLSGGAPGSRGSGYLTTGAHLHFEVIKDGVHVDPMPYMDPER